MSTSSKRSKTPLIMFLLLVVLAMSTTLFLLEKSKRSHALKNQNPAPDLTLNPNAADQSKAEETLENTGAMPKFPTGSDPMQLMQYIGKALALKDYAAIEKVGSQIAIDSDVAQRLKNLISLQNLSLKKQPVREVGELELNTKRRYALELEGRPPGNDQIYFDLLKKDGVWLIEKVISPDDHQGDEKNPAADSVKQDALALADQFLLAALRQDFITAKKLVNPEKVSDATLAGLCILFEEGSYRIRSQKPLRAMIQKPLIASFLAHVEASDGSQAAQFAVILRKSDEAQSWIIDELNLDQLLSDYAKRVAGGDVYYSPLIKNPTGGDTLVLYFEFDEGRLTPRTERQLAIVANILKTDPNKKIRLSGHTDAKGTAEYNQDLSAKRADSVKEYLIGAKVSPQQITTIAKGLSEPRRPNVKASGEDDPDGRRVNRRTEIYLDF